jgi:asparagine synthase (glutamine-hydrolysing)
MTVTPQKRRTWQYWHLENTPELRLPSFEAYVEGLLEVYDEAVRCRLRSQRPVGVTLSGGLDSGSVTALAARALDEEGKRLPAYVSVPLFDTSETVGPMRFGNELALAQATATHCGNVDVQPIDAAHITPMAGVRRGLEVCGEPAFAAGNQFWIVALMQEAQRQGVGTLLTGQGGNATISWVGQPQMRSLSLMLQREGWKSAVKLAMPIPLLRAVQQVRSLGATWDYTAINPDFAGRINLAWRRASAIGRDLSLMDGGRTALEWRLGLLQPASSAIGAFWAEKGASFGIEVRDPTLDRRVMAYTFGVPDAVFDDEKGLDRRLIRAVMAGLLPDEVRLNRMRGRQAADLGFRLQKSANEVETVLAQIQFAPACDYVNVARMRQVWADIQEGPDLLSTHRAVTILLRGASAGLYLNRVY